jgi:hypothetical protein
VLCGWRTEAPRTRVDTNRRRLSSSRTPRQAHLRSCSTGRTASSAPGSTSSRSAKLAARIARADGEAAVLGGLLEVASEAEGRRRSSPPALGRLEGETAGLGEAAVAEFAPRGWR